MARIYQAAGRRASRACAGERPAAPGRYAAMAETVSNVAPGSWIETRIPHRLDRLPWCRWHWLVVAALGVTWILDGLEVTLGGAVAGVLRQRDTLALSDSDVGLAATCYLIGAVAGALVFGYLTDRFGRKRLFTITLGLYLTATALTGLAWDFWSYALFRALTGAGIGGEGAAINSAIDELIPARVRGWADLAINGSYWIGAAIGAAGSIVLLDPRLIAADLGWRLAFLIGAAIGLIVLWLRRFLPESPRWLVVHGRVADAGRAVATIEAAVGAAVATPLPPVEGAALRLRTRRHTPLGEVVRALLGEHRRRAVLGFVLMVSQAFFYNAIFFTYALVLVKFYAVPGGAVGWYLLPFALGNFLGPLLLGRLFDTIGRRTMIATTYAVSGVLLALTGWLFERGLLGATEQTIAWTVIFFIASSAASAAYLTVSEVFPLEMRALAIAVFYACGTGVGGVFAPWLFGHLIEAGTRTPLFWGYLGGAALMLAAAAVAWRLGVAAERRPLEAIAEPLSCRAPAWRLDGARDVP
jgi:MFS family permease